MTKQELTDFALLLAKSAMGLMVEMHGSFHQQAVLVDRRGARHMIFITDKVMHGPEMRAFLLVHSLSIGGADAILVQADARVSGNMTEEEAREVSRAAKEDRWLIAENPKYQEVLVTAARSREHQVFISMPYDRKPGPKGDVITFKDPEPQLMTGWAGLHIGMIPDIWGKTN